MKQRLGIIGIGAFGEFMLRHVTPYFDTLVFDARRDLAEVGEIYRVKVASLRELCECEVLVLAVPVAQLEKVAREIAPHLRAGQLVLDVASVKMLPAQILQKELPAGVELLGLHPLFGPQSGRAGIHGLNVALCDIRGGRGDCVAKFLSGRLGLNVIRTTPEQHDLEMAYVQGLTHMLARVFVSMDVPPLTQTTRTFELFREMVELVRYDSDELFRAIERENPHMDGVKEKFFSAIEALQAKLGK